MAFMLCDHIWAALIAGNMWLTCIGRLAFPIFAFMIAEGFYHTRNRKKYLSRLLIWALISEIPFDLMCEGVLFYPFHQNVLWTFVISLLTLMALEKIKKTQKAVLWLFKSIGICIAGWLFGTIFMVDYFGEGVIMVVLFYMLRGKEWWKRVFQAIGMIYINCFMIEGLEIPIGLSGSELFVPLQGFAILSLPIIWLYKGRQGPHNRFIKTAFYCFYPAHLLVIYLIAKYLL